MSDLATRYGMFEVTWPMMREAPERLATVLAQMLFVPTKVECDFLGQTFTYWGYSHLFTPLDEGVATPQYRIKVTAHEDDSITVNAIPTEQ